MLSLDTNIRENYSFALADKRVVEVVQQTWYVQYGKRLFDVTVSLLVIIFILSWMLPVLGVVIKATSTGPMFFRQKRTGRQGREFWCFKFRTMYNNPEVQFAQCGRDDPRVTQIGRFLRRSNLDEMPQFLNVLAGDMSVVGPRPHAVKHDDQYWFTMTNYHIRYQVRPGITGLAQVRGARGETKLLAKMKHRLQYDMLYVKRQSITLDLKLCFMTLGAMLKGNVNAW